LTSASSAGTDRADRNLLTRMPAQAPIAPTATPTMVSTSGRCGILAYCRFPGVLPGAFAPRLSFAADSLG
jgi:hypothetical protein